MICNNNAIFVSINVCTRSEFYSAEVNGASLEPPALFKLVKFLFFLIVYRELYLEIPRHIRHRKMRRPYQTGCPRHSLEFPEMLLQTHQ